MGVFSATTDGRVSKQGLASRPLREDHDLPTSLDKRFSDWKVLVGPDDWRDHHNGREGAAKYRLDNLPSTGCFHSGVYELALHADKSIHAHGTRKGISRSLGKHSLVPVYVGQADNVRDRLQVYGRNGSHLEGLLQDGMCQQCGTSFLTELRISVVSVNQEPCSSPHLFTRAFERGFFIAFRWTATKHKDDAAALEALLLQSYDYAWNRGSNGKRRPEDALEKLQHISKWYNHSKQVIDKLWKIGQSKVCNLGKKRVAANLVVENLCGALDNPATRPDESIGRVFEVLSIYRKLMQEKILPPYELICSKKHDGHGHSENIVCGIIDDIGNICTSMPPPGRKRCEAHKGMRQRLRPTVDRPILTRKHDGHGHGENIVCGIIDDIGNICTSMPSPGRKRCEAHKGMRRRLRATVDSPILTGKHDGHGHSKNIVCGIIDDTGNICTSMPPPGRKRCEAHKGMRWRLRPTVDSPILTRKHLVNGPNEISMCRVIADGCTGDISPLMRNVSQAYKDSGVKQIFYENNEGMVCGYISKDGSKCMALPVKGRKRCSSHKGRRIKMQFVDDGK